jgi:hypothetical protein
MGNMSYCRFENTARDLSDCLDAIKDGQMDELSIYERRGLNELLYYARQIVHFADDIMEALKEYEEN